MVDECYLFHIYFILIYYCLTLQPSHCTEVLLLHIVDCWYRAVDDGKFVVADSDKGFDFINHSILLIKPKQYLIVV